MPPRKDLGSFLVDEGVLELKDLERVREQRPLWSALVDGELASAEQIFRALSSRFGVPTVSDERLAELQPPEPLKLAVSRAEALAAGLLPIDLSADGQRATVVMIDPSDERTLADFLTRVQVPEGRALLGRHDAIVRAIDRCYSEPTAVATPLPPPKRRTPPRPTPAPPLGAVPTATVTGDDDVTGTVRLDPSLQAEIQRLPARMTQAEALTPLPRPRPRRQTPPPTPAPQSAAPSPSPPVEEARPETPSEALRAEERLTRALVQTVEALASELEARIVGGAGVGAETARLARRVARQLGLGRRAADEIGVAAQLFALDRLMRSIEGLPSGVGATEIFGELGWAAAGDAGLVPTLRALTAAASGFGRTGAGAATTAPPVGARIIGAVADYQELGAAATAMPDLDTVSQLLRASSAGAQVVDALLRVLESERGDKTPATPTTLPATSMLRDKRAAQDEEPPTPPPALSEPSGPRDDDKTQRKPYPRKEGSKGE